MMTSSKGHKDIVNMILKIPNIEINAKDKVCLINGCFLVEK